MNKPEEKIESLLCLPKNKKLLSPRALHQTMGTSLKQNKYKHTAYKIKRHKILIYH